MKGTKRRYMNCNSCNERDDFDDMVRCDNCDGWYHYYCAGVSQRIKDLDWVCQVCLKSFSGNIETKYTGKYITIVVKYSKLLSIL